MVMSTVIVYSASSSWAMQKFGESSRLVSKHIIKILIGFGAMLFALNFNYNNYKNLQKLL